LPQKPRTLVQNLRTRRRRGFALNFLDMEMEACGINHFTWFQTI